MVPIQYDVERETDFNRLQLGTTIPDRLNSLLAEVDQSRGRIEDWYADLIVKVCLSLGRICIDLLATTKINALPSAAWNARNLLELWVWTKYCSVRDNARGFHEDAVRDMKGLAAAHPKMCGAAGIQDEFGQAAQDKLSKLALDKLGLPSLDSNYTRVDEAAKAVGLENHYGPNYKFLSKLAHPTAGLVIGIMHQEESLRGLQRTCTTMGLYFAGQCVIALEETLTRYVR